jgi:hypothetical protein
VNYGPDIGGRIYICPVKGVAISRLAAPDNSGWSESGLAPPLQTRLNDVTFPNYHRFRADVRIVGAAGDEEKAAPH